MRTSEPSPRDTRRLISLFPYDVGPQNAANRGRARIKRLTQRQRHE